MKLNDSEVRFIEAAAWLSGLCLALFYLRESLTGVARYSFILPNMLLAWLALFFGWLLVRRLRRSPWLSAGSIALTVLWLVFLPNTWYVMSDFIHIEATGEISPLYDITLFTSLLLIGFGAGFMSLYLVHCQLVRRMSSLRALLVVILIVAFASFAIYLGRDLRWNSYDIIANPGGLILNVSDRLTEPFGRPRMFNVSGQFFVIIGGIYAALWRLARPRN